MRSIFGISLSCVAGALFALTFAYDAAAAGSCGSGGVLGEQEQVSYEGSLYYVTTPAGYTGTTPVPVIFGLHGDEGDPARSVNWFWRDVPDDSFIFVAPKAPNSSGSWYEEQDSNEAWFDGLVEAIKDSYNVDLDRVYIWGLSGGAVFSSRYTASRQDVFAAAEFNMGGSGTRQYVTPQIPGCLMPARFAIGPTDFLREGTLGYYELLTENGHETEWQDASCDDHCWDEDLMEGAARDWLLEHTLCGRTPETHCADMPPPDGGGTDPNGSGGINAGGGTGGSVSSTGSGAGGNDGSGASGSGTNGSSPGTSSDGSSPDGGPTTPDYAEGPDDEFAGTVAEDAGGCAISRARAEGSGWGLLGPLGAMLLLSRRRRRGSVQ